MTKVDKFMPAAPRTKQRNAAASKIKILRAAQTAFSHMGYAKAGIRDIAEIADVSSTLLLRYYGSKAGLFEAALIDAVNLSDLLTTDRSQFGRLLASLFVDESLDITPPAMLALSTGHPESQEIASRVAEEYLLTPLAKWLGAPDGRVRALEIFMLATSFVLYTRQVPLAPTGAPARKKLADWLAASVQAVVDGTPP